MICIRNKVAFCDSFGIKVYLFDLVLYKKEFGTLQFHIEVTKKIRSFGVFAFRPIALLLYSG